MSDCGGSCGCGGTCGGAPATKYVCRCVCECKADVAAPDPPPWVEPPPRGLPPVGGEPPTITGGGDPSTGIPPGGSSRVDSGTGAAGRGRTSQAGGEFVLPGDGTSYGLHWDEPSRGAQRGGSGDGARGTPPDSPGRPPTQAPVPPTPPVAAAIASGEVIIPGGKKEPPPNPWSRVLRRQLAASLPRPERVPVVRATGVPERGEPGPVLAPTGPARAAARSPVLTPSLPTPTPMKHAALESSTPLGAGPLRFPDWDRWQRPTPPPREPLAPAHAGNFRWGGGDQAANAGVGAPRSPVPGYDGVPRWRPEADAAKRTGDSDLDAWRPLVGARRAAMGIEGEVGPGPASPVRGGVASPAMQRETARAGGVAVLEPPAMSEAMLLGARERTAGAVPTYAPGSVEYREAEAGLWSRGRTAGAIPTYAPGSVTFAEAEAGLWGRGRTPGAIPTYAPGSVTLAGAEAGLWGRGRTAGAIATYAPESVMFAETNAGLWGRGRTAGAIPTYAPGSVTVAGAEAGPWGRGRTAGAVPTYAPGSVATTDASLSAWSRVNSARMEVAASVAPPGRAAGRATLTTPEGPWSADTRAAHPAQSAEHGAQAPLRPQSSPGADGPAALGTSAPPDASATAPPSSSPISRPVQPGLEEWKAGVRGGAQAVGRPEKPDMPGAPGGQHGGRGVNVAAYTAADDAASARIAAAQAALAAAQQAVMDAAGRVADRWETLSNPDVKADAEWTAALQPGLEADRARLAAADAARNAAREELAAAQAALDRLRHSVGTWEEFEKRQSEQYDREIEGHARVWERMEKRERTIPNYRVLMELQGKRTSAQAGKNDLSVRKGEIKDLVAGALAGGDASGAKDLQTKFADAREKADAAEKTAKDAYEKARFGTEAEAKEALDEANAAAGAAAEAKAALDAAVEHVKSGGTGPAPEELPGDPAGCGKVRAECATRTISCPPGTRQVCQVVIGPAEESPPDGGVPPGVKGKGMGEPPVVPGDGAPVRSDAEWSAAMTSLMTAGREQVLFNPALAPPDSLLKPLMDAAALAALDPELVEAGARAIEALSGTLDAIDRELAIIDASVSMLRRDLYRENEWRLSDGQAELLHRQLQTAAVLQDARMLVQMQILGVVDKVEQARGKRGADLNQAIYDVAKIAREGPKEARRFIDSTMAEIIRRDRENKPDPDMLLRQLRQPVENEIRRRVEQTLNGMTFSGRTPTDRLRKIERAQAELERMFRAEVLDEAERGDAKGIGRILFEETVGAVDTVLGRTVRAGILWARDRRHGSPSTESPWARAKEIGTFTRELVEGVADSRIPWIREFAAWTGATAEVLGNLGTLAAAPGAVGSITKSLRGGKFLEDLGAAMTLGVSVHGGEAGVSAAERVGKFFGIYPNAANPARQAALVERYLAKGYTREVAEALAKPYQGMGEHFLPRRALRAVGIPERALDSPFTVLKPRGISYGEMFELHFGVDRHFFGAAFGPRNQLRWSGLKVGAERFGALGKAWYGTPIAVKATGAAAGASYGIYKATQSPPDSATTQDSETPR